MTNTKRLSRAGAPWLRELLDRLGEDNTYDEISQATGISRAALKRLWSGSVTYVNLNHVNTLADLARVRIVVER